MATVHVWVVSGGPRGRSWGPFLTDRLDTIKATGEMVVSTIRAPRPAHGR